MPLREMRTGARARFARIEGLGAYRPRRTVTNDEICERIDSDDEWIRARSGIVTRGHASAKETLVEMGASAARAAVADAGLVPADIDCVIVTTLSSLRNTPSVSAEIAHELGLRAGAFDVGAACAGFNYALTIARDLVRGGSAGRVLVVSVERLSDLTDFEDRTTAFLFADGAGAVVVGPSATPGIGAVVWGSEGSKSEAIRQHTRWDALRDPDALARPGFRFPALSMVGQDVYRWATSAMVTVAGQAMAEAGVAADDLAAFVPHQANLRITETLVRALGLPRSVVVARDIVTQGNTGSASIPLAMEALRADGAVSPGDLALIMGYGAGLVHAAQVVAIP
ncbi:beta-ketoacyl-ACP synthase 3 [Nocardia terpenica]|uniref:3-oxoacyl-ACP synthase n=1 Tax=Nocardia terpenica TaxID=455432 RepID=A0A164J0J8_9NOCA|nr:beta-ketoacyl-ACP synthase 3 [Nocardia terpenica]KZM69923.1 3-oxoacyl-ACP synthase [Nocardia terpenica]